mgnify:CR=1 FL=1
MVVARSGQSGLGPRAATPEAALSLPGDGKCHGVTHAGASFEFEFPEASSSSEGLGELLVPMGESFFLVCLAAKRVERRSAADGTSLASGALPASFSDAQGAGGRVVGATRKELVACDLVGELGQELWRVPFQVRPGSWLATPAGLIAQNPAGRLIGVALEDGAEVWAVEAPASFLAEADEEGVLLLAAGSHTRVSERSATTGAERWAFEETDHSILGLGLGGEVALVRRVVSLRAPSDDPFELPTYTESHQVVGLRRESGEVLFSTTTGAASDALFIAEDAWVLLRSGGGRATLEAFDLQSGDPAWSAEFELPGPEPAWWRATLVPGPEGPWLLGYDLRNSPISTPTIEPRFFLRALG